jgi:hypothetical protein
VVEKPLDVVDVDHVGHLVRGKGEHGYARMGVPVE